MTLSKEILATKLVDDNTPYGGTAHEHETLEEFLNELEIFEPYDITINDVNSMLVECGIQTIGGNKK